MLGILARAVTRTTAALAALVALGTLAPHSTAHAQTAPAPGGSAGPAASPATPAAGPSAAPAPPAPPAPPSRISVLLSQPAPTTRPTPEQDREARAQFLQGREAFARGQFLDAAERFERAYELSRRAVLLYNLGTSYDRLHRWEEARDAFRRYIREVPAAPEREEVNSRLAVIDQTIAHETEMREAAIRAANTPRVVVVERPRDRIVYQRVGGPRPLFVAGLVVGGLGVISGMISGVVAIVASIEYDNLFQGTGCGVMGVCEEDSINLLRQRPGFVNGTLGAAIGLVAIGGALLIVDARRPRVAVVVESAPPADGRAANRPTARRREPTPWWAVTPTVSGQYGGLTITGVL